MLLSFVKFAPKLTPQAPSVLAVCPVDDFVGEAIFRASVMGDPARADPVHREIEAICARRAPERRVVALDGPSFYARVKAAHTVVATGEPRLYANVIVRKGVIYPEATGKP